MNPCILFLNGPECEAKLKFLQKLRSNFTNDVCIYVNRKEILKMFNAHSTEVEESFEWILQKMLKNILNNGVYIVFDVFLPTRRMNQYAIQLKGLPCYWLGIFMENIAEDFSKDFYDHSVVIDAEGEDFSEQVSAILEHITNNAPCCFTADKFVEKQSRKRLIVSDVQDAFLLKQNFTLNNDHIRDENMDNKYVESEEMNNKEKDLLNDSQNFNDEFIEENNEGDNGNNMPNRSGDDLKENAEDSSPPAFNRDGDRRDRREGFSDRPPRTFNREGGSSDRGPRSFSDRPPRTFNREGGSSDRGPRSFSDRPPRTFNREGGSSDRGPRSFSDRPPRTFNREGGSSDRGPRSFSDRPPRTFNREGGSSDRGPRSFSDRPPRTFNREGGSSDRGPRSFSDRPPRTFNREGGSSDRGPRSFSDRPPRTFNREGGSSDRGPRSFSDRPSRTFNREGGSSDRGPRSFSDRPPRTFNREGGSGGRKSFGGGLRSSPKSSARRPLGSDRSGNKEDSDK